MDINFMDDTLSVGGFVELTAANRGTFKRQISAALHGQTSLEIDLSRTTSMDCAGFGALIALGKLARGRRSSMRLLNPTTPVRKLFDLVQAGRYLDIVSTAPAGDAHFPSPPVFSMSNLPEMADVLAVPA
jgi:anti-anti-sigma factor